MKKGWVFLGVLGVVLTIFILNTGEAVPSLSYGCNITADITSINQTGITLRIVYVASDEYCENSYPIESERIYHNPTYSRTYDPSDAINVSAGQTINTTIDVRGDENSNGYMLLLIKIIDDSWGGPVKYGRCGDGKCNYGENTPSYPYYCPQDCPNITICDGVNQSGEACCIKIAVFEEDKSRCALEPQYSSGCLVVFSLRCGNCNQTNNSCCISNLFNQSNCTKSYNINRKENDTYWNCVSGVECREGKNTENRTVKIMPDTASQTAIARLGLKVCNESNNCTIILKDTGIRNATTNETKIKYVITALKDRKFLWWHWKKLVKAEIDADTGEVI